MSRSIKKMPILKDGGRSSKWAKRQANKKIRNSEEVIPKGGAYKKLYEQWEINDFICYKTEKDAIEEYYDMKRWYDIKGYDDFEKDYGTLEDFLVYWRKLMKNK